METLSRWRQALGIARSLLMYYAVPFRAGRRKRLYAQFARSGDLCFDIGAHVGNHLRAFLSLGARVVAVEPQPQFARLLRRWYGHPPAVIVVEQALGASPGRQNLLISTRTPTVTTLSPTWAAQVGQAAAFAHVRWDASASVEVTTLDALIERYGEPSFCKIDAEGYELEILKGLSRPLRALALEYIPAAIEIALDCIGRLAELGGYRFNWTVGEALRLCSPEWLDAPSIIAYLQTLPPTARSGDIYARLVDAAPERGSRGGR